MGIKITRKTLSAKNRVRRVHPQGPKAVQRADRKTKPKRTKAPKKLSPKQKRLKNNMLRIQGLKVPKA
jgi:hypothetical protein|tara:strand:+ start:3161 stop:3364 length:204 start_codon:yes stop_codon:yes gene_type:complete